jgi:hypothetical protein
MDFASQDLAKLRFENRIKKKKRSSKLGLGIIANGFCFARSSKAPL